MIRFDRGPVVIEASQPRVHGRYLLLDVSARLLIGGQRRLRPFNVRGSLRDGAIDGLFGDRQISEPPARTFGRRVKGLECNEG